MDVKWSSCLQEGRGRNQKTLKNVLKRASIKYFCELGRGWLEIFTWRLSVFAWRSSFGSEMDDISQGWLRAQAKNPQKWSNNGQNIKIFSLETSNLWFWSLFFSIFQEKFFILETKGAWGLRNRPFHNVSYSFEQTF